MFYQTLPAFELLAAASDSVSSSAFIRSASRRCHLFFPRAYITHAPAHTQARADARPGDRRLTRSARTFWLASLGLCFRRSGEEGERVAQDDFTAHITAFEYAKRTGD